MRKAFYLMLGVSLFFIFFIMQKSVDGSDTAQAGISTKAEAATEMSKNDMAASNINAVEDAEAVPASTSPKIMGHNDSEVINRNYASKSNFEKQADKALSLKVQQTLTGNPQLKGKLSDIQITAVDGSVILKGMVNSEEDRSNIVDQIENMAGVDSVDNQLRIENK